jgi:hypothetical protein
MTVATASTEADARASPKKVAASTVQANAVGAKSVAIAQLIGAVLFAFGSGCFVRAAWAEEWVQPFRIGCAAWIGGCVPYLWPPLRSAYVGSGGDASSAGRLAAHLSNALQVASMLSWAVGSAYAFHDDIDIGIVVTKATYLAGSACLLGDALLQARELRSAPRNEQVSLLADLLAGLFYVLAGGFEGYATRVGLMRFGSCSWLVGSLFSCIRPCLALSGGRCARPARTIAKLDEVQVAGQVAATASSSNTTSS